MATIGGDDELFGRVMCCGGRPVRVGGFQIELGWGDPDLEEVRFFGGAGIELRVGDTAAGAHHLDFTWMKFAVVAHRIAVGKATTEDVGKNFHIPVRVGWEAAAGCHAVIIDDAQRAKSHVGGIVVIREGKGVVAIKPAVVGVSALVGAADVAWGGMHRASRLARVSGGG